MTWIGARGFWIEDNEWCEIIDAIDEGAGVYEFMSLDRPVVDLDAIWIGNIEDFMPEC